MILLYYFAVRICQNLLDTQRGTSLGWCHLDFVQSTIKDQANTCLIHFYKRHVSVWRWRATLNWATRAVPSMRVYQNRVAVCMNQATEPTYGGEGSLSQPRHVGRLITFQFALILSHTLP